MISPRILSGLACALLLISCQQATGDDPGGQGAANSEDGSADPASQVLLRADGLEVTGAEGIYLAFDSPRETVERELARALGPISDRSRNAECGAGTVNSTSFPGGLTVNFQAGRLKGWFLGDGGEGAADITTVEGIGLGSDEGALDKAYSVEAMESTLGDEFVTDQGISGFLTGQEGSRKVEALYSGATCFFR